MTTGVKAKRGRPVSFSDEHCDTPRLVSFRLGKWEKDVLCGLANAPDNIRANKSEDYLKLDKIAAKLSLDDRERLEAGKVVPTLYIQNCWGNYSFFAGLSEEEMKDLEGTEIPQPSRAVKSRTLKTLQNKKLIIAENLGLKGCRKFYSLTAEGEKITLKANKLRCKC